MTQMTQMDGGANQPVEDRLGVGARAAQTRARMIIAAGFLFAPLVRPQPALRAGRRRLEAFRAQPVTAGICVYLRHLRL
ncbi:MAG: hypothetical protein ABI665_25225 [Vicinamibacterales bacterium]